MGDKQVEMGNKQVEMGNKRKINRITYFTTRFKPFYNQFLISISIVFGEMISRRKLFCVILS